MTKHDGGPARIRTRLRTCIDLKTWGVSYAVQVNMGDGWSIVVREGKLALFDTKESAKACRAELRAKHRSMLAARGMADE